MQREVLKSKIHRATVTESNRDYEGSITIDEALMSEAHLVTWEKVLVANVTNGSRLETYCIPGKRGSGVICVNGAAAHHAQAGDIVLIISFALFEEDELARHRPQVVKVDASNRIVRVEALPCPVS